MSAQQAVLLATANAHKVREFERLLVPIQVDPLPAGVVLPPETGDSYAANALIKARAAAQATGRLVIADDSGIEAEALGGAPGIRSARFAGEQATDAENLAMLIERVPAGTRLEYVCVIALVDPSDGSHRLFEGRCVGKMALQPSGAGGFGYDPIFIADTKRLEGSGTITMAELSDAEKDAISHRGAAARSLMVSRFGGQTG